MIGQDSDFKVDINIFGDDRMYVVDPSGSNLTNYSTDEGFFAFALNPDLRTPTEDSPVILRVVASAEGYVSTSQPIRITEDSDYDYVVYMLELDNPADGVVVLNNQDIGLISDGIVEDDIVVSTTDEELSIVIKANTILKDANGALLNGDLTATLVYFDPTKEKALSAFPGGLDVTVSNEQGVEEEGYSS